METLTTLIRARLAAGVTPGGPYWHFTGEEWRVLTERYDLTNVLAGMHLRIADRAESGAVHLAHLP